MIKQCQVCNEQLKGKQTKFCSGKCKAKKFQANDYASQQKRGRVRKTELILLNGGECMNCGYSKNSAALQFHHRNPSDKSFCLDMRRCSNNKMSRLISESKKCDLLCANCHAELHSPDSNNWKNFK